jgi:hypothetical protein
VPFAARHVEGGRRTRRWRLLLAGPVYTLKLVQRRPLFEFAEAVIGSMAHRALSSLANDRADLCRSSGRSHRRRCGNCRCATQSDRKRARVYGIGDRGRRRGRPGGGDKCPRQRPAGAPFVIRGRGLDHPAHRALRGKDTPGADATNNRRRSLRPFGRSASCTMPRWMAWFPHRAAGAMAGSR